MNPQDMSAEELMEMHDKLAELLEKEEEEAAEAYLIEQMPKLPQQLRDEIIARAYFDAVSAEAQEMEAAAQIQEHTLAVMGILKEKMALLGGEKGEA